MMKTFLAPVWLIAAIKRGISLQALFYLISSPRRIFTPRYSPFYFKKPLYDNMAVGVCVRITSQPVIFLIIAWAASRKRTGYLPIQRTLFIQRFISRSESCSIDRFKFFVGHLASNQIISAVFPSVIIAIHGVCMIVPHPLWQLIRAPLSWERARTSQGLVIINFAWRAQAASLANRTQKVTDLLNQLKNWCESLWNDLDCEDMYHIFVL